MRVRSVTVGLVVAGLLAGCTAGGTGASPTSASSGSPSQSGAAPAAADTVLKTALQSDIASFDPDNNFEVAGLGAILSVYQGLVSYAPGTTKIQELLAKSWTISADKLTYTFTLRNDVKFASGKAMTSADVKASFTRRMLPNLELSYFLGDVASMQTPSPTEFVLKLKAPDPGLLDSFCSPWGPKVVGPDGLVTHAGTDHSAAWLTEHADGTGPFELTSFVRGQGYVLDRNPNYWGAKPFLSSVQLKIVPDIGQQVLKLRSGDLDIVQHGYPFSQLSALPAGLTATSYNDLGLELAFLNPHRNLKTVAQRRTVEAGLNPAGWLQDAFGTYATPPKSLFPASMLSPSAPLDWPASAVAGTSVPSLEIAYDAGEAGVQQRVADLLISQLKTVGVTATARAIPGAQISTFAKNPATAPDILLAQNNPDSADPGSQASLFYTTGGGLNVFAYSNPAADKDFATAASTADTAARNALFDKGGKLIFDDGGFVPLGDLKDVIVYRGTLSGFGTKPAVPWTPDYGTLTR